ncbi:MAG TPA: 16S rRNA (adenine(1518)-N(6)/adenine(1519)-N(6))-dimethyltransferase RsmA [Limnobacter sp.]|uniref:16S rRNA (adenine(1518)-N(6)/adenine(1519)-N(6))- dimethyltransferase RsmA n=1 Tax=Limnobacter sp. TaxID=2003368 RepID=UPI002EDB3732
MKHQARKRFGQHFLTDQTVLANFLGDLRPSPADTIVEIGPGLGALTVWLLKVLPTLHVIEIDRDLAQRLRTGPWKDRLTIHEVDVLKFNFHDIQAPFRVVGNLPYNISSPILFALLEHADRIVDQQFMLQKEVIDRMVAKPRDSDYGRLSVMLQAYYDMTHLFDVPPECFDPPPRVMSAIVRMVPKAKVNRDAIPGDIFSRIVSAAFSQRRKMLRNTWADVVPFEAAAAAGIELTARAEEISAAQYVQVAQWMLKNG